MQSRKAKQLRRSTVRNYFQNNWQLYLMLLVPVAFVIIFKYAAFEQTIAQMSPVGLPQDFTQALIDNYYQLRTLADEGKAYSDPVFAVAIESESEYSATLLSLWQEYYAKLVKCDPAEFEGLFAQYSQEFLDAGYQEIIDDRLEAYKNGNTTKLPALP